MSEPIHIISLGGGVQSSTMALMAAAGEITPMPVASIFADTHSDREWRRLRDEEPEEFSKAVQFERDYQAIKKRTLPGKSYFVPFLHTKRIPLDQVDLSTEEERGQLNMFNNECEGMCGV